MTTTTIGREQSIPAGEPPSTHVDAGELRRRLLSPWPEVSTRFIMGAIALFAAYVWAFNGTNASPAELAAGVPNIINFIARLFPPQFELPPTPLVPPAVTLPALGLSLPSLGFPNVIIPYPDILTAIIETIQMAIVGTSGGILLSLPFGLLAARNTSPHPWVYQTTRMLLNANRAIPDIVFALIFVAAVGLGPFGGVLALAVGSVGSLGKLYAESIESIDPQQVLAVQATGANRLLNFIYSVMPQALPVMASYSLLLFEHNVRSATILGLVGAGGVGFTINKYLALFQYQELLGAMILIIITVTVIDRVSDHLRKKII
ncbi:MAG TPA: phosphonate ABC transporter, permease protein PhnE [Anaerolineae bacterium]|nr:phosphonate ABC transporter, permease protein PhnE [Anaerolineae bacterium]